MSRFDPELEQWENMGESDQGDIFTEHAIVLIDCSSIEEYQGKLQSLYWSKDTRPAQDRLKIVDGMKEIAGVWYGHDEDGTIVMTPPSLQQLAMTEIEAGDSRYHSPTIQITLSPFVGNMIARLLLRHADNQKTIASCFTQNTLVRDACTEQSDEATSAADALTKAIARLELPVGDGGVFIGSEG